MFCFLKEYLLLLWPEHCWTLSTRAALFLTVKEMTVSLVVCMNSPSLLHQELAWIKMQLFWCVYRSLRSEKTFAVSYACSWQSQGGICSSNSRYALLVFCLSSRQMKHEVCQKSLLIHSWTDVTTDLPVSTYSCGVFLLFYSLIISESVFIVTFNAIYSVFSDPLVYWVAFRTSFLSLMSVTMSSCTTGTTVLPDS